MQYQYPKKMKQLSYLLPKVGDNLKSPKQTNSKVFHFKKKHEFKGDLLSIKRMSCNPL